MKKKVIPAIIIIALIFIIGGIYAGQILYQHYSYSTERADLDSYFDIKDDTDVAIILGNERIEERAYFIDGHYYMDFASVQKYLNDRFYYGIEDGLFIYTTPTAIITSEVGSSSWSDTEGGSRNLVLIRIPGDSEAVTALPLKKSIAWRPRNFPGIWRGRD